METVGKSVVSFSFNVISMHPHPLEKPKTNLYYIYCRSTTFRCKSWKDEHKCKARVKHVGDIFYLLGPHTTLLEAGIPHPNEEANIRKIAFEAECKAVAATEPGSKKRKFEDVRQR